MIAMLEIKGEKDVTIQPYLPEECYSVHGCVLGDKLPKEYDCFISVEGCDGCLIERVKPSPTGKAYYEIY